MINLLDFGSFYIGGREVEVENAPTKTVWRNPKLKVTIDPNGLYTIESMYIDYYIPKQPNDTYVLIHGGGHTGAVWNKTPDGRDGWLQLLLQKSYRVYVVDTVERGRSSWCSLPNIWQGEPEQRSEQAIWYGFRLGSLDSFDSKIAYVNQQFPISAFHRLTQYDVPRWNCNATSSANNIALLLDKVGPAHLIAHSQGADVAMQAYEKIPGNVKSITLLEPAAFPDLNLKDPVKIPIKIILGDYIDLVPFWTELKKLTLNYVTTLNKLGLSCEVIDLPKRNIIGNSHMLMMDKNSNDLLDLVLPL